MPLYPWFGQAQVCPLVLHTLSGSTTPWVGCPVCWVPNAGVRCLQHLLRLRVAGAPAKGLSGVRICRLQPWWIVRACPMVCALCLGLLVSLGWLPSFGFPQAGVRLLAAPVTHRVPQPVVITPCSKSSLHLRANFPCLFPVTGSFHGHVWLGSLQVCAVAAPSV